MTFMSTRYMLRVPRDLFEAMLQQARAELPNECCGLLAGMLNDGVGEVTRRLPLINAVASPIRYFSEPRSMLAADKAMRTENLDLLAVYHSHPTSEPVPSRTDLAENFLGSVMHLIISLHGQPAVRAWWLSETGFEEAEWECVE
jgi:proteasome lid subunit RPN8/RPN11